MMRTPFGVIFAILCLGCTITTIAQEVTTMAPKKELKVRKHTVLGQYEPEMVIPADERLQLKSDRLATIKKKRKIIDTLDISDRKRRQLLKELYRSPFTYKWDKVIATIEAEDEEDVEDEH